MIMFRRPNVWIDTLGICQECRKIFTVQWVFSHFLEMERIVCLRPGCGRVILPQDAGYEVVESGGEISFVKKKWIRGPDGIWTSMKPKKEFDLPEWHIVLSSTEVDFDEKHGDDITGFSL